MPNRFAPESKFRLDRHIVHVAALVALLVAGIGILYTPEVAGFLQPLPTLTQNLLAICVSTGAALALMGSIIGPGGMKLTAWIFPSFEVRNAYLFSCGGLIAIDVGLGYFSWNVIANGNLIGTATGPLSPALFLGYLVLTKRLWTEHHRMTAQFNALKKAVTDPPPTIDELMRRDYDEER